MHLTILNRTFGTSPQDTSLTFDAWGSSFDDDAGSKEFGSIQVKLNEKNDLDIVFLNESLDNTLKDEIKSEVNDYYDSSGLGAQNIGIKDMLLIQREIVLASVNSEYGLEECCRVCRYTAPSYSPEYCISCIPE